MSEKKQNKAKAKAKPGRKRMGRDVFVPVTMKVEPSELATIEMIAKASKRSRSDVMREMVTLGMQQMLESAFAPKGERETSGKAAITPVMNLGEDNAGGADDALAQRRAVEALMPAVEAGTATRDQWAELAWRSAAILCVDAHGDAGEPPAGPLKALSILAPERADATVPGPLQTELGFPEEQAAALGRAARLVLKSGLLEGEVPSVDAESAVRDAVMTIADAAVGAKTDDVCAHDGIDEDPELEAPDDPKLARALSQKGAREIVDYVSRHPRANTSELLAATGISSSTLRRRIVALQDAGAILNDGTATRPVWRVPGVEHSSEEMLTATQSAVLGLMRRQPPTPTGQISSELGLTKTAVTLAYHELADLGLAFKDGGRWRATPQKGAEGAADA